MENNPFEIWFNNTNPYLRDKHFFIFTNAIYIPQTPYQLFKKKSSTKISQESQRYLT